ncbi:hypothetical protein MUK42_32847 [Musa troglodytarum]|uniref:Uncharacterized protein n=1 Tax=Musa troglodytarum TaxID=320322 RepID=A0A9E7FA49_9LILI|nr:hypothetical protein MUK42_32847 [Musa troglodytarum]
MESHTRETTPGPNPTRSSPPPERSHGQSYASGTRPSRADTSATAKVHRQVGTNETSFPILFFAGWGHKRKPMNAREKLKQRRELELQYEKNTFGSSQVPCGRCGQTGIKERTE